ncbi:putative odorant receptor 92a [Phymastichus coffea]|uniref:putative odorant receptor 92a n=1 Tax=Phymastichus coffea TaxID=108790 RepID=UPI00273BAE1D|nr:putative odorant receptor 92a [Phymastichus coffea]
MSKVIDEVAIEHNIFFDTFFCLSCCGLWKPTTSKPRWFHLCYNLYRIYVSIVIGLMAIGPLTDMLTTSNNNFAEIMGNWCFVATVTDTWLNSMNVMLRRKQIMYVLKTKVLIGRWTSLRDAEENRIIEDSKNVEQKILRYWMCIVIVNGILNILNPIIGDNPDNNLVWKSWVPCDRSVSSCFWICWAQQAVTYMIGSTAHVSAGAIALNFLERICSHFRILQHRLTLLPDLVQNGVLSTAEDELLYLIECIHDHQNIYSTAREISRIFSAVIFAYFVIIFFILCTNIYVLSILPVFTSAFMAIGIFLCCMMLQFFLFCWWGYKLTETGNETCYTIFSMNWLELRKETRKRLRFIMLYTSKSIPLFNNFVAELSPEMFLKMLKTSYSAFNLLQAQS